MNIVPIQVQEHINRIDRNRSLVIGVSAGLTALWSLYRLFWLFYTATALSSVGWSPVSLVFPLVLWGAIGVAAGFVAFAFLHRYAKRP
jgi:predicted peptidase